MGIPNPPFGVLGSSEFVFQVLDEFGECVEQLFVLVGLWVGLLEVLDIVEGGMWGIAFPFVASPQVDEVVMGDLVEVALWVFA